MRDKTQLRIGDVVTVFEDPMTSKKPEGKAKLRKLWSDDKENRLEYWEVQFLEDNFVADRWIQVLRTNKNKEALDNFFSKI